MEPFHTALKPISFKFKNTDTSMEHFYDRLCACLIVTLICTSIRKLIQKNKYYDSFSMGKKGQQTFRHL